jgi:LPXTG-motif cell wall-anchored protein
MLEALTGSGLAAAAGMNAYIPLVTVGLLSRYDWIELPPQWQWLQNGWVLLILSVLLVIEVVADKVPIVDHINDILGTVVRPTAGGLAFGATSGAPTLTVPGASADTPTWVPILVGAVIALVVHGAKVTVRPVANVATAGAAAPVLSTTEDLTSVAMSVVAIVLPVLVLVGFGLLAAGGWYLWRRRTKRKALRRARDATV